MFMNPLVIFFWLLLFPGSKVVAKTSEKNRVSLILRDTCREVIIKVSVVSKRLVGFVFWILRFQIIRFKCNTRKYLIVALKNVYSAKFELISRCRDQ